MRWIDQVNAGYIRFFKIVFDTSGSKEGDRSDFDRQEGYLDVLEGEYRFAYYDDMGETAATFSATFSVDMIESRPSYEDILAGELEEDYPREEYEEEFPIEGYHTEDSLQSALDAISKLPYVISVQPTTLDECSPCAGARGASKSSVDTSKDQL